MAGFPSEKLGGISEHELQAILEEFELWKVGLSPFQRRYYLVKGWYYEMNTNIVALVLAIILAVIGLVSWVFGVNPWASFILTALGIVVGIIAIWELERRR